jgi:hypothetical protein
MLNYFIFCMGVRKNQKQSLKRREAWLFVRWDNGQDVISIAVKNDDQGQI